MVNGERSQFAIFCYGTPLTTGTILINTLFTTTVHHIVVQSVLHCRRATGMYFYFHLVIDCTGTFVDYTIYLYLEFGFNNDVGRATFLVVDCH